MTVRPGTVTIIRGGRLLDARAHRADPGDILVIGDTISEIGPPGLAAPAGAVTIDARGMLLHPGLINAHTHGHGNLAKGMGDRWTLELLLTAAPWINGNRSAEDRCLSAKIGAVEMVLKGCTAAYDLPLELPVPTHEGVESLGRAYADVGMRAVLAPMVADRTLYEAIPGLMEVLSPSQREDVAKLRLVPWKTSLDGMRAGLHGWTLDRQQVGLAVAPTIPHHCSDEFIRGCADLAKEYGVGLHSHVAESKVQAVVGLQRYGKTLTAHLDGLGALGPHFTVAHGVWLDHEDMTRLADHGASVAHNPGSNMRLGNGFGDMKAMLERGVNVGIGTDGANCSDNQNVFEAMRLASLVSKGRSPDMDRWVTSHRRQRAGARLRRQARPAGARLSRRHRVPRSAASELDSHQRSHQPARPHRGRRRGDARHDRRTDDRRASPSHHGRFGGAAPRRRGGAPAAGVRQRAGQGALRAAGARGRPLLSRSGARAVSRRPLRRRQLTQEAGQLGVTTLRSGGQGSS